jgi:hypothetical protein
MGRRSSRVPRAAVSVVVAGEPPYDAAVATGPQQEVAATAAATVATTTVESGSPALVPTAATAQRWWTS